MTARGRPSNAEIRFQHREIRLQIITGLLRHASVADVKGPDILITTARKIEDYVLGDS